MGRTVPSIRIALDRVIKQTWQTFRRGLRKDDQAILDQLLIDAQRHTDAGSLTAVSDLNILLLMSILIEQAKRIRQLQAALSQVPSNK